MTAVMPETLAELVVARGLPVTEKDLVAALDEAVLARHSPAGAGALSGSAGGFLSAHAGIPTPDPTVPDPAGAVLVDTAAQFLGLVATSLTGEQAADRLGIDASTVRGRISRGELHAVRVGRRNRLPAWQFTRTGTLPHLGSLLPILPRDLHPLEVEALFVLPTEDLALGDDTAGLSPRDWLLSGGDPARVADLIVGLSLTP